MFDLTSTSSYRSEDSTEDSVVTFGTHREHGRRKLGESMKVRAHRSCGSWRRKYGISSSVEIYHGVDLADHPFLGHTIVFCEGFLKAGISLPLSSLATTIFNYVRRAPQQFDAASFIPIALFDCWNEHHLYGNGGLTLEHFLYYYTLVPTWVVNEAGHVPKGGRWKGVRKAIDYEFYKHWLVQRVSGVPTLLDSKNLGGIFSLSAVEVGGKICVEGSELHCREMNLSDPPKGWAWSVAPRRHDKVDKFYRLDDYKKRKVCHGLPLARMLFPNAQVVDVVICRLNVIEQHGADGVAGAGLTGKGEGCSSKEAVVAADGLRGMVLTKKGTKFAVGSGGGLSKSMGTSTQMKPAVKATVETLLLRACLREPRVLAGGGTHSTRRSKMTGPVKLKLTDAAGKALPGDLSAFKDEALAARLLRVNVLPCDFDQSVNLLVEDHRMMLACLQYEVHCLEITEWDAVELKETEAVTLKKVIEDIDTDKVELRKAKSEAKKLAVDAEVTRAALAEELVKLKLDMAELQKATDVAIGEGKRLNGVVEQVSDELADVKLVAKAEVEVKDAYVRHLAFLLDPLLNLLPSEVADKIRSIQKVFGV